MSYVRKDYEKETIRIKPPFVGLLIIISAIGFFLIALGVLFLFTLITFMLVDPANIVGELILLAFVALLLLLGGWGMKVSQRKANELLEFETASSITNAKALTRGREKHRDAYGGTYYTYWILFEFTPEKAETRKREIALKTNVTKKIHDKFTAGRIFNVRYAHANPRIVLMEWETRNLERSYDPRTFFFQWILANIIGGVTGFFISNSFYIGNPLLFGAIAGLILSEVQWAVLYRYVRIPNWIWVAVSTVGWAIFIWLSPNFQSFIGGVVLGVLQWLVLRRYLKSAEMWVPSTVVGAMIGHISFGYLVQRIPVLVAAGVFDLAYGGVTGIALYSILRQQDESSSSRMTVRST